MRTIYTVITVLFVLFLAIAGCTTDGDTGPKGDTGPAMPVIQSVSTDSLPASPGGTVTVYVSAQSPEDLDLTYVWDVTPADWSITSGQSTDTVVITAPSSYGASGSAEVSVTDTKGRTGTAFISLITEDNVSPVIHSVSAYPNPAYKGEEIAIDASVSDPNGDTVSCTWTIPAGFSVVSGSGTPNIIIEPEVFTRGKVSVTADDGAGGSASAGVGVYVFDGTWRTPELLETNISEASTKPDVAVDPSGNAVAVWQQYEGTLYSIWARRYTPGTGWGTPELLETDDTNSAGDIQVDVDPLGNAIAVWAQDDGTRFNIWSNRYTAGSGWGTAELIETDNAGGAYRPNVAVDPSGNAVVVWRQSDGLRNNIWANYYTIATGWGTAELIETDNSGSADYPKVVIDDSGNAVAVWRHYDGSVHNIMSNRYTAGSGWGSEELIETNGINPVGEPCIDIDPSGNCLAVWNHHDGVRFNIWSNRYTAGSGWGTAELIETDNTGDAFYPNVSIDADGNAIAVWQHHDGTRHNIMANRYTAGTGWGTAELIEKNNEGHAYIPKVILDPFGNAVAVWRHNSSTVDNIVGNRYIPGIGWGTPERIEFDNRGSATNPQLGVDQSGNVTAVWQQHDGTENNCMVNIFK